MGGVRTFRGSRPPDCWPVAVAVLPYLLPSTIRAIRPRDPDAERSPPRRRFWCGAVHTGLPASRFPADKGTGPLSYVLQIVCRAVGACGFLRNEPARRNYQFIPALDATEPASKECGRAEMWISIPRAQLRHGACRAETRMTCYFPGAEAEPIIKGKQDRRGRLHGYAGRKTSDFPRALTRPSIDASCACSRKPPPQLQSPPTFPRQKMK